jgi:hypothetical protein
MTTKTGLVDYISNASSKPTTESKPSKPLKPSKESGLFILLDEDNMRKFNELKNKFPNNVGKVPSSKTMIISLVGFMSQNKELQKEFREYLEQE